MNKDNRYPWYVVDILVFLGLNLILIAILQPDHEDLTLFSPFQFIVFALAVYRGAHLISNEVITKPLRAPFVKEVERNDKVVEVPKKYGFRGSFGALIHCASCTGVWVAFMLTYFYLISPGPAWIVMLILALSGIERFLTLAYDVWKKKI